jgi:hypothetical protein
MIYIRLVPKLRVRQSLQDPKGRRKYVYYSVNASEYDYCLSPLLPSSFCPEQINSERAANRDEQEQDWVTDTIHLSK